MADGFVTEEEKKSKLAWALMQAGYIRPAAEWIADNVPTGFYPGWTAQERVDWLYSSGVLAKEIIPLSPEEQEQLDAAMRGGIPFGEALQFATGRLDAGEGMVTVGSSYNDIMRTYGVDPLGAGRARAANIAARTFEIPAGADTLQRARFEAERQRAEAERQTQIRERVRELYEMMPEEAPISAPFLEQARGISPAFQRVTEQRLLPDIFAELSMPQKRREWWETGAQRIAEQLLPETQQEKELMALRRADPWAQLLSQPTFLQQLETRFRGLSPTERGVSMGRFKPRTRFLA